MSATKPSDVLRKELTDPITLELMEDPVSVPCCGKAFSRASLVAVLESTEHSGHSRRLAAREDGGGGLDPEGPGFACPLCNADLGALGFCPRTAAKNVSLASLLEMLEQQGEGSNRVVPGLVDPTPVQKWSAVFTPVLPGSRSTADPRSSADGIVGELELQLADSLFKVRPGLFVAVLDRSGSMGNAAQQVMVALKHIHSLANLPDSSVELVMLSYGSDCQEIHLPDQYCISGGTNFRAAFRSLSNVLQRYICSEREEDRDKRNNVCSVSVAFLTDGCDMSPDRSAPSLVRDFNASVRPWIAANPGAALAVHSIGFTRSCDQGFLEALRNAGTIPGVFQFCEASDGDDALCGKVVDVFEVAGMSSTVPLGVWLPGKSTAREVRMAVARHGSRAGRHAMWAKLPRDACDGTGGHGGSSLRVTSSLEPDGVVVPIGTALVDDSGQHERQMLVLKRWVGKCLDELAAELLDVGTSQQEANRAIAHSPRLRELYCALFENRLKALEGEIVGHMRGYVSRVRRASLGSSALSFQESAGAPCDPLGLEALEGTAEQLHAQLQSFRAGSVLNVGKLGDMRFASRFGGPKKLHGCSGSTGFNIKTVLLEEEGFGTKELPQKPLREFQLKRYCRAGGASRGRSEVMQAIVQHVHYRSVPELVQATLNREGLSAEEFLKQVAMHDLDGNHALHLASYCGHKMTVQYLLDRASVILDREQVMNLLNCPNKVGETCVTFAIKARGFHETLDVLMERGGTVPQDRKTALVRFCFDNGYGRTGNKLLKMSDAQASGETFRVDDTMSRDYLEVVFQRAVGQMRGLWEEHCEGTATEAQMEELIKGLPMDWLGILDVALHLRMDHIVKTVLTGKLMMKADEDNLAEPAHAEADKTEAGAREQPTGQALPFLSVGVKKALDAVPIERVADVVTARCFPREPDAPDTEEYLALFRQMLERFPQLLHVKTGVPPEEETLLIVAVKRGSLPHLCYMLDQGADPEAVNHKGTTALGVAAFMGYPCIVSELIMRGADVHHVNFNKHTPLRACCFKGSSAGGAGAVRAGAGHLKCAEELLAQGADVGSAGDMGESAVITCCRNGSALVLQLLLSYVNLDFVLRKAVIDGFSCVMAAAEQDRVECIEVLYNEYKGKRDNIILEQKTDESNEVLAGGTALHIAAYYGRSKVCETLVRLGATVNSEDANGRTPLHTAVIQGHAEIVRILLSTLKSGPEQKNKVDVHRMDKLGNRAISYARGNAEIRGQFENRLVPPLMLLARQAPGPAPKLSPAGASAEQRRLVEHLLYPQEEREIAHDVILKQYASLPEGLILDDPRVFFGSALLCSDLGSTPITQAVLFGNASLIEAVAALVPEREQAAALFRAEEDAYGVKALTYARWAKNPRLLEALLDSTEQNDDAPSDDILAVQRQLSNLEEARAAFPRIAPQVLFLGPPPVLDLSHPETGLDSELFRQEVSNSRMSSFSQRSEQFVNAPCILNTKEDVENIDPQSSDDAEVRRKLEQSLGLLPELLALANSADSLQVLFTDRREQNFDALLRSRLVWHSKCFTVRQIAAGVRKLHPEITPLELMVLCLYTNNSRLSEAVNGSLLCAALPGRVDLAGEGCPESAAGAGSPASASLTPNLKNFTAVLYRVLKAKLPVYAGGECFLAGSEIDRKLYQKGTRFTWNRFVSTTTLWKVALENVPSFTSKSRRGTVLLVITKKQGSCARLVRAFSEFSHDSEVVLLPNAEFVVTNWYHGDVFALGQPNVRVNTFLVKELDSERLGMEDIKRSDKSLIVEVTEV